MMMNLLQQCENNGIKVQGIIVSTFSIIFHFNFIYIAGFVGLQNTFTYLKFGKKFCDFPLSPSQWNSSLRVYLCLRWFYSLREVWPVLMETPELQKDLASLLWAFIGASQC